MGAAECRAHFFASGRIRMEDGGRKIHFAAPPRLRAGKIESTRLFPRKYSHTDSENGFSQSEKLKIFQPSARLP